MIIKPLNSLFYILLAAFIAVLVIVSIVLKDKPRKTKRIVLGVTMFLTFIYYWIYKYEISIDLEYAALRNAAGIGSEVFTWFGELPLHLCNINLMLIPIACLTDNKRLYSFCFFCAPLGAFMALLMPGVGFEEGYSLFVPRIIGYFFTHFMVLVGGLAVGTFGLYKPQYKDTIPTALIIILISFIVFIINIILRKTGLYEYANYFYNIGTDGNPILEIFYKLIPVPFIYEIPLVVILIPYILLVTTICNLPEMIAKKQAEPQPD